jgi:hypothetical protein
MRNMDKCPGSEMQAPGNDKADKLTESVTVYGVDKAKVVQAY